MWICATCKDEVDDNFDLCWNCQTSRDAVLPASHSAPNLSREMESLRERISAQSDNDLRRIVDIDFRDYRAEALEMAKAELARRGLAPSVARENPRVVIEPKHGAPPPPSPRGVVPVSPSAGASTDPGRRVMNRYTDAYRVARITVTIGTIIKVFGGIVGVLIAFAFIAFAGLMPQVNGSNRDAQAAQMLVFVVGAFWGVAVFVLFFIGGVLVSAQGQILKASLDSAVHSSPFVSNDQKAKIMSLI